jgi:hypothetical protein
MVPVVVPFPAAEITPIAKTSAVAAIAPIPIIAPVAKTSAVTAISPIPIVTPVTVVAPVAEITLVSPLKMPVFHLSYVLLEKFVKQLRAKVDFPLKHPVFFYKNVFFTAGCTL